MDTNNHHSNQNEEGLEEVFIPVQEASSFSNLSKSSIQRWKRRVLIEAGLKWTATPEEIESKTNKIKKKLIHTNSIWGFEWLYNKGLLPIQPKKRGYSKRKEHHPEDIPEDIPETPLKKEKGIEGSEKSGQDTILVNKDYLEVLKAEYENKKKLEEDYRNKDNQINLIVDNLRKAMGIMENRIKQLEAPKDREESPVEN